MITDKNINKKALWESVYYFLEKTVDVSRSKPTFYTTAEIRRLIITDGLNWFLFDAHDIYDVIKGELEKKYYKYKNGQLIYKNDAPAFYAELRQYFDEINITEKLDFIYFNIKDCLNNKAHVASIYNLLSESYLLKNTFQKNYEPHALNSGFYHELLYIMGLQEKEKNGKLVVEIDKTIKNSLAYQVYNFLQAKEIPENELVEYTFELVLIWINRLLFVKLFEGQLISFNNSDDCYTIINHSKITGFKDLDNLFFEILGKKERGNDTFFSNFAEIPYLNSSLFEKQDIEKKYLFISYLENSKVKRKSKSVLGKKAKDELFLLEYIIDFLNSYNFSSGTDSDANLVQNKEIIDAAVLGLIFEKLNGYKDGAFFTPSVITEYMCKEIIENIILDKINAEMNWNCKDLENIIDKIETLEERKKINAAINKLKICDPSVGSGHFLVSALNRIIAIKMKLKVLFKYNSGERLKEAQIYVENDVLIVKNGNGEPFIYNKNDNESREVQETLFNEKRTIIENCLFGVDINPKAVYIAQLRLWIELLKNAYYKNGVMETLPNIDINIKVGNSLISKVDYSIGKKIVADKDTKKLISKYKELVTQYKSVSNKESKRVLLDELKRTKDRVHGFYEQIALFDEPDNKYNEVYDSAFEWAFEFPEILDEDGKFLGFDAIIGNPPYGLINKKQNQHTSIYATEPEINFFKNSTKYRPAKGGMLNIYRLFVCLSLGLLRKGGKFTLIFPMAYMCDLSAASLRGYIFKNARTLYIEAFPERDNEKKRVFEDVKMSVCILGVENSSPTKNDCFNMRINSDRYVDIDNTPTVMQLDAINQIDPAGLTIPVSTQPEFNIFMKMTDNTQRLGEITKCFTGEIDLSLDKKYVLTDKTDGILLRGAQVQKYYITNEISQGDILYLLHDSYLANNSSPRSQHHKSKRILMQGITGVNEKVRLKMTLCDAGVFCANSVNYIIAPEEFSTPEYLLGILNSRLINWFFSKFSTNSNVNGYEVDNLPIIKSDNPSKIHDLVVQILEKKKINPAADTSSLEAEIDKMVYELYGLTEEEIAVVET